MNREHNDNIDNGKFTSAASVLQLEYVIIQYEMCIDK